jgi:hypothetical protein
MPTTDIAAQVMKAHLTAANAVAGTEAEASAEMTPAKEEGLLLCLNMLLTLMLRWLLLVPLSVSRAGW